MLFNAAITKQCVFLLLYISRPHKQETQPLAAFMQKRMSQNSRIVKLAVALIIFTMSTNSDAFATENNKEVPQLPAPDPDSKLPKIKLGETISFEQFGPIILNTDGSTRRITNWDILTEAEKAKTWERISKRNEKRRQSLLKQQEEMLKEQDQKAEDTANEL